MQGTILDDDTVVQALEDLKGEAGDVAKEVQGAFRCSASPRAWLTLVLFLCLKATRTT